MTSVWSDKVEAQRHVRNGIHYRSIAMLNCVYRASISHPSDKMPLAMSGWGVKGVVGGWGNMELFDDDNVVVYIEMP